MERLQGAFEGRLLRPRTEKRRRPLPKADVERRTRTLEILDDEGTVVCRVETISDHLRGDLDAGESRSSLVLEGIRGHDDELRTVERFLRDQLELEPCRRRELDGIPSALRDQAGSDPSALDVELSPDMTAGAAVRTILSRLRDVIAANVDGVLRELDTEFLHDLRVAVRRSRSVLGQIKDVFPRTAVEHYGAELRWLGDFTGHARDLDVFLLRMPSLESILSPEDAGHLEPLAELLRSDRAEAQSRLVEGLSSERFRRLLDDWRVFLLGRGSGAAADAWPAKSARPVLEVSSRRIWKRYRKVRKVGRSIHHGTPASRLHALRIECKKLRYLLEVFASLYPRDGIDRAIKGLKRLQNTLGELNDCRVQARMLRELSKRLEDEERGAIDAAVAIGVLVARLDSRREEERERFFERFEGFAKDGNHRRYRELFARDRGKG